MPKGRPSGIDAAQIRQLAEQGLNSTQIAEKFGVNGALVRRRARRYGISLPPAPRGRAARNGNGASGQPAENRVVKPRIQRPTRLTKPAHPVNGNQDWGWIIARLEEEIAQRQKVVQALRLLVS